MWASSTTRWRNLVVIVSMWHWKLRWLSICTPRCRCVSTVRTSSWFIRRCPMFGGSGPLVRGENVIWKDFVGLKRPPAESVHRRRSVNRGGCKGQGHWSRTLCVDSTPPCECEKGVKHHRLRACMLQVTCMLSICGVSHLSHISRALFLPNSASS